MMQSWDTEQMTGDSETVFKRIGIISVREPTDSTCCSV